MIFSRYFYDRGWEWGAKDRKRKEVGRGREEGERKENRRRAERGWEMEKERVGGGEGRCL